MEVAAELTVAWLSNQNNRVAAEEVPVFLRTIHATVVGLSSGSAATADCAKDTEREAKIVPAVRVRKSLASKDHILSIIDGKPYKALRRHLATNGLTPGKYRTRHNLKPEYPMIAPSYSEPRRVVAHKIGLGTERRTMPSSSARRRPSRQVWGAKSAAPPNELRRATSPVTSPGSRRRGSIRHLRLKQKGGEIASVSAFFGRIGPLRARGCPDTSDCSCPSGLGLGTCDVGIRISSSDQAHRVIKGPIWIRSCLSYPGLGGRARIGREVRPPSRSLGRVRRYPEACSGAA